MKFIDNYAKLLTWSSLSFGAGIGLFAYFFVHLLAFACIPTMLGAIYFFSRIDQQLAFERSGLLKAFREGEALSSTNILRLGKMAHTGIGGGRDLNLAEKCFLIALKKSKCGSFSHINTLGYLVELYRAQGNSSKEKDATLKRNDSIDVFLSKKTDKEARGLLNDLYVRNSSTLSSKHLLKFGNLLLTEKPDMAKKVLEEAVKCENNPLSSEEIDGANACLSNIRQAESKEETTVLIEVAQDVRR